MWWQVVSGLLKIIAKRTFHTRRRCNTYKGQKERFKIPDIEFLETHQLTDVTPVSLILFHSGPNFKQIQTKKILISRHWFKHVSCSHRQLMLRRQTLISHIWKFTVICVILYDYFFDRTLKTNVLIEVFFFLFQKVFDLKTILFILGKLCTKSNMYCIFSILQSPFDSCNIQWRNYIKVNWICLTHFYF